eukprot:SAG31_NODE_30976_length_374_cov_0.560000_1_plen_50_part_01
MQVSIVLNYYAYAYMYMRAAAAAAARVGGGSRPAASPRAREGRRSFMLAR